MMSYNSRPPGGGVGASSSARRALPLTTSVQPIQNTQRIRIDNDETESSLYTSPSTTTTTKLVSPALPASPRQSNSNKPQQATDRLSPVEYNTTSNLASSQRRKSSNGAASSTTAPTKTLVILNSSDTSLSHVKRQWLRAFEAMRYDLPSVSTL